MPSRTKLLLASAVCFRLATELGAQTSYTRTPLDGATPPGLNPAGNYALSGFDEVNLYSGRLNFSLPLLTIGGRGEARHTMMLRVQRNWTVSSSSLCPTGCGPTDLIYKVDPVWWNETEPGYGPGLMFERAGWNVRACDGGSKQDEVITRFHFMRPDGGEVMLLDKETTGRPLLNSANTTTCSPGTSVNRKREFATTDGSATTFYLDNDYTEVSNSIPTGTSTALASDPVGGTGRLQFRDGTVYRIGQAANAGRVDWIRDRNGNRINFQYDAQGRVDRITDPVNRITTVAYTENLDTITYDGFAAAARTIKVERQDLSASLAPGEAAIGTYDQLFPQAELNPNYPATQHPGTFNPKVAWKVTLPDDRFFLLQYNRYGELKKVTLPTGGYYEYDYEATGGASASGIYSAFPAKAIIRVVKEKRTYLSDGQLSSRVTFARGAGSSGTETTVTYKSGPLFGDETLRTEKHYFYGQAENSTGTPGYTYSPWKTGLEFKTEINGLRRMEKTFAQRACSPWFPLNQTPTPCVDGEPAMDPRVMQARTTLLDAVPNKTSKQMFTYDQFNNQTLATEYDFGESTVLRRTMTEYQTGADYVNASGDTAAAGGATFGAHLRSIASRRLICAATGICDENTFAARTDFVPDEGSLTDNTAVQWQAPQLGGGAAAKRGNITTERRYRAAADFISQTMTYDRTGNVLTLTNPRSKITTYAYADNCSAGPANSFAYPTTVTNATGHATTGRYDCALGRPVKITGPNADETLFDYNDPLDRIKKVTRGADSALASATNYGYAGNTVTIQADRDTLDDKVLKTVVEFDGLGREWIRKQYESATEHIDSKKLFDGLGRAAKVCNPYRKTGAGAETAAENCASTQSMRMQYDGLDRVATTTNADGSTSSASYAGPDSTHTDETGNSRTLKRDALGRLTSVGETAGGVSLTTDYPSYDLLDNLKTVTQGTQPSRTFTYDRLSRLESTSNPESGPISYTYDNNGNLLTRTGARSVVLTMTYDNVDRPLSKTYTGVATPAVAFGYDTCTKGMGRLCSVSNTAAVTSFTYDLLGRAATSKQKMGTPEYDFSYTYNRADALASMTYPTGRVITTSYDAAGRPESVIGGSTPYASGVQYWPHGAMKQMTLGNGLIEQTAYNERLQMRSMQLGANGSATAAWKAEYCWGSLEPGCSASAPRINNGNLQAQTISAPGFSVVQKYGYDELNRLLKAEEGTTWKQDFVYDRWGNRALKTTSNYVDQVCTPVTTDTTVPFNAANNRWSAGGVTYDLPGNFTGGCGKSYSFDGENRLETVDTSAATYSYDGQDRRVKLADAGGTTVWVYDAFGSVAAEYRTGTAGVAAPCVTCYLTADHLGSTRVVSAAGVPAGDGTNLVMARHDYLPFGEEIPAGWGARTVGMKYAAVDGMRPRFTGKERDAETGLDYFLARYYSSAQGRFTSPDEWQGGPVDPFTGQQVQQPGPLPYADITNPQSLNKYGYVLNNPLRYTDPDGHCVSVLTPYCPQIMAGGQKLAAIGEKAVVAVAAGASAVLGALASPGYELGTPDTFGGGNPNVFWSESKPGTLGKPDHQETVKEEGRRVNGSTEVRIETAGGKKDGRRADAVGTNPQTGKPEIVQVYRPTPAGNIPKRERDAAADIQGATGIKPTMVPVRPLPPKPSCTPTGGTTCP